MRFTALLAAALVCGACGGRPPAERPDVAPAPAPSAPRPLGPVPSVSAPPGRPQSSPPEEVCRCIRICIVRQGRLLEVPATYNPATGDTLTEDGLPFSSVAPLTGEYASVAGWFVNREPIRFRGGRYGRSGRARVLGMDEVFKVGEYQRVGVYAETGDTAAVPRYLYLPTRPGCEFQPYERLGSAAPRSR